MPTNKQRRDAQRRHLERQLERRREREVRRRKSNLIISIAGTLVLIGAVVLAIVLIGGSDDAKKSLPVGKPKPPVKSSSPAPPTTPTPSTSYPAATGAAVKFNGVTIAGATDLKGFPGVLSKASADPDKLGYKDLVVGNGAAATQTSSVTVQYTGVLYKDGKKFDSSWDRGMPAQFSLGPGNVIDGFTQGIGGTDGVPPMKIGGRRIIIMPSALGYGPSGQAPDIPPNSPLVFVVDLVSIGG